MSNNNQNNPFVMDRIVPERQGGGGVYQVTADSVSPTRTVGYDDAGLPIEETVCCLAKSEKFVDLDGNICDIALRTGRVYSEAPEAERYEILTLRDIIGGGQLPLNSCPYTTEFRHIKGGPLVKVPPGKEACDGATVDRKTGELKPCEHMMSVIEERRARARIKYDKQQAAIKTLDGITVEKMMAEFGKLFNASQANPKSSKDLVAGKGEKA